MRTGRISYGPAKVEDDAGIAGLLRPYYPLGRKREALPAARRLLSETERVGGHYLVARLAGQIVGGCQIGPLLRDHGFEEWWILGLEVQRKRRRQGIGNALVRNAVDTARGYGETRIYCYVAASNLPSLRLFEKTGFRAAPDELRRRITDRFGPAFPSDRLIVLRSPGDDARNHSPGGR